jgi:hypothetical protein
MEKSRLSEIFGNEPDNTASQIRRQQQSSVIIAFSYFVQDRDTVGRLVGDLQLLMPEFNSSVMHVGFVLDEVPLGQVFLRKLNFFLPFILPPILHAYLPSGNGRESRYKAGPHTSVSVHCSCWYLW